MAKKWRDPARPIDKDVDELLKRLGFKQGRQRKIQVAWKQVAGEEYSEKTRAVSYRQGILTVEVSSAALRNELRVYLKKDFLAALRKRLDVPLQDIKFRLVSASKPLFEERPMPSEEELFGD